MAPNLGRIKRDANVHGKLFGIAMKKVHFFGGWQYKRTPCFGEN